MDLYSLIGLIFIAIFFTLSLRFLTFIKSIFKKNRYNNIEAEVIKDSDLMTESKIRRARKVEEIG